MVFSPHQPVRPRCRRTACRRRADMAGRPLTSASFRFSSTPSVTCATSPRVRGRLPAPQSPSGGSPRPGPAASMRSGYSAVPRVRRPSGGIGVFRPDPPHHVVGAQPQAVQRTGSRSTLISRFRPPTIFHLANPGHALEALLGPLFHPGSIAGRQGRRLHCQRRNRRGIESSFWMIARRSPGRVPRMEPIFAAPPGHSH